MNLKRTRIISLVCLVFFAVVLSVMVSGVLTAPQNSPVSVDVIGRISSSEDIGVFLDPQATIACTNVDCGKVSHDSISSQTIYIKNTGKVTETLKMIRVNFNPLLSHSPSPLTVTWSQEGISLTPGSIVPATLNLKMASDTGSFSEIVFNVVFSGTV